MPWVPAPIANTALPGALWLLAGWPHPTSCGSLLQQQIWKLLGLGREPQSMPQPFLGSSWGPVGLSCMIASCSVIWVFLQNGHRPGTGAKTEAALTCKNHHPHPIAPWNLPCPPTAAWPGALLAPGKLVLPHQLWKPFTAVDGWQLPRELEVVGSEPQLVPQTLLGNSW